MSTNTRQSHWNQVYATKAPTEVSWYQPHPERSLGMIRSSAIRRDEPIIDVGGGASLLVDELLASGYRDLTVLDVSAQALRGLRERLGNVGVQLLDQDITGFRPVRRYALWHDRAVFHFLTEPSDREAYQAALRQGLQPGGHLVIATFGPAGPERCSGLPVVRYDAPGLARELGPEFHLVDSREELHRTPWGSTQQFVYAHFRRHAGPAQD